MTTKYNIMDDDIDNDIDTESFAINMDIPITISNAPDSVFNDLREYYIHSDSPITLSSSDNGSVKSDDNPTQDVFNALDDKIQNIYNQRRMRYKKLTYQEIENSLTHYYEKDNKYTSELGVLTTFVKGQKHLYMQSKYVTQLKLYIMMFSALFITAASSVLSAVYVNKDNDNGNIIVACMNAISAILIYTINYLKLETSASLYFFISNQYDRLENSLEFTNNKMLFITNETEQNAIVLEKIKDVEFKMTEIKEIAKVGLPKEIGRLFPLILYVNVFSFIKKMEFYKKNLIIQYRDVKNEIRYIIHQWNLSNQKRSSGSEPTYNEKILHDRERTRMSALIESKERIRNELIHYKDVYNQLDNILMKEIKYAESFTLPFYPCVCLFPPSKIETHSLNPMIQEILT